MTLTLVLANVLVHALLAAIDNRAFMTLGYEHFLVQWGANVPGLTLSGEWWRLGSSMFLHAGVTHLLVNCVVLFEIGRCVEPRFGSLRLLVLYLLSGLGGALASATWHSLIVSAGASGAIFGLIGAMVVFGFGAPGTLCDFAGRTVSPRRLLISAGLTLLLGLFLRFDNLAHLGGFATGVLLSSGVLLREKRGLSSRGVFTGAAWLVAVALVVGCLLGYEPSLARQIRFAQLLELLQGGSADLRQHLRRCAEDGLQGEAADYQQRVWRCLEGSLGEEAHPNAELVSRLKSDYEIWIELNGRSIWPQCQKRARQLELLAQTPAQRQGFTVAREYCQARLQLEAAIFAGKPVELPVQRLNEQVARYGTSFESGVNEAGMLPDPEDEVAAALQALFRSMTPEAGAYASLDVCPYMTCYRPWAARFIHGSQ